MRSIILNCKLLIFFLFFSLIFSEVAVSQSDLKTANYSFASSRFAGLGNACISLADGAWATFANPAGLVRMHKVELSFQQNIDREKYKFDPKLIGIKYKIWRFTWANKLAMLKEDVFDYTYTGIGVYISSNIAYGMSFIWKRRHPADYFQILGDYLGFLSGMQYFINPNHKFGAILQMTKEGNIMIVGVGYGFYYKGLKGGIDLRYEEKMRFNLGFEQAFKYFILRVGYDSANGIFIGAGKDIKIKKLWLYSLPMDFAYNLKTNSGQWTLKFCF